MNGDECEHHQVRFDISNIDPNTTNPVNRGLACHELGHALDLRHFDNPQNDPRFVGCMYTEGPYANHLSPHDRSSIDFAYPYPSDDRRPFTWIQAVGTSDFEVVDRTGNRLDLFVRSTDGAIWHLPYPGAGAWSSPVSLGGGAVGGPTAISLDGNRLDVFARGSDNALWHNFNATGTWSGWSLVGGTLTSDPEASSVTAGRLDVFARGVDNGLYHTYFSNGWYPWENLGGVLTHGPSAVATPDGRTHVVAVGANSQLYYKQWTGSAWTGYSLVGGEFSSAPDLTALSNRVDVVGRGGDGRIYHSYRVTSAWATWELIGGWAPVGGPTATWRSATKFDVFARGEDNFAYYGFWDGTW